MATLTQKIASVPPSPGVYLFKDTKGVVLYVGKAVDLARRVRQYFKKQDDLGAKTRSLVSHIEDIKTIETADEFDALLLEARLIREYLPKYNVIARDDKSPLYVSITFTEKLPRILLLRRTQLPLYKNTQNAVFGPFQSGRTVRSVLHQLRGIIPYCTQKRRTGVPCFYTHIGLCNPCASQIEKMPDGAKRRALVRLYRKNMFFIRDILSGKSHLVLRDLEKEMRTRASLLDYEKAKTIRNQITALESLLRKHYDPNVYVEADTTIEDTYKKEITALRTALMGIYPTIDDLGRIECIDISHTFGQAPTGSVVVLTRGQVDRSQYRRFRIRGESPNDTAGITEVLTRRLRHAEWPMPDLFVIDGGKGQLRAAYESVHKSEKPILLIALAKRFEEVVCFDGKTFTIIRLPLTSPAIHLLQRIRDEAHRFALSYHRLLRKKSFTP